MKESTLYRLEIAPLLILPLGRSPLFSYASYEGIALGSLVRIPFGTREIEGIVYACQPLPGKLPNWMKCISKVIIPEFLTQEQCELGRMISDEYFTSLGKTLKHFLPKQVKARTKKATDQKQKILPLKTHKDDRPLLDIFAETAPEQHLYLDTSVIANPKRIFALLIKKMLAKKQQTLLLVPEITLIPALEAQLCQFFPEESIATLHSQLADGPYFEAWERIRLGSASIIIATRQGLFAPFKHLGLVIITEEQDESYKQWDMSPRYDGRIVASMLTQLHRSKLLSTSNTPSTESLYALQEKIFTPLVPIIPKGAIGGALTIVNLRLERFKKNYSPLSEELFKSLRETLAAKRQALLYINRQGMNAFSVCENCKNILRCKECHHALTSTKEGYFRCLSCHYKTSLFPSCPTCGHLSFRNVGFGTERIEKEVTRAFPGARIFRADSQTMRKGGMSEELYQKAVSGKIDILIGTQMILKDPPLPKLSLIAMIDADSLLSFPNFLADERFFQHLTRAVNQVASAKDLSLAIDQKVIVQTFHPESTFFQRISGLGNQEIFEQIVAEREALSYPPFSRLISITYQGKTSEDTEKTIRVIFETLEQVLPKAKGIRISPPQPPRSLKRRDSFESSLVIRIPKTSPSPHEIILTVLKKHKHCIVDVDPISFH